MKNDRFKSIKKVTQILGTNTIKIKKKIWLWCVDSLECFEVIPRTQCEDSTARAHKQVSRFKDPQDVYTLCKKKKKLEDKTLYMWT